MRKNTWLVLIFMFALGVFTSCKPKVDCDKLETKLIGCLKDNTKIFNPAGCPEEIAECKQYREKLTADYAKLVDTEIVAPCRSSSGRDSRAARINVCLDRQECKDVHACLKEATR